MNEITRRIVSGICFAVAALIPVAYYFLLNPFEKGGLPMLGGSTILTVAVPVLFAAAGGLSGGAEILDPEKTMSVFGAVLRGLLIGWLSYFLMFSASAVVLILIGGDIFGVLILAAFLFFYGLLYIGWLIAFAGAAAGGGLYLVRLKIIERNRVDN